MMRVIKTYGHERGLSATFRQHRATSHCRFLHGYALGFTLVFECPDEEVDENGWVINFGGLKPVEKLLKDTFDHKLLIAEDDPEAGRLLMLSGNDDGAIPIADMLVVPAVGCEAFAKYVADRGSCMLDSGELGATKARLISVECREHGSNAAVYICEE
jgi:6-pyruvoyltetrahydropterin/6-carboxytetrahydropterin synthase